jgi:hypothetical protein
MRTLKEEDCEGEGLWRRRTVEEDVEREDVEEDCGEGRGL